MTVSYLGSLTIGDLIPGATAVAIAGAAGINAALPDIQARLAALAAFSPAPVSFTAQLALANQLVASIQLSITLGITPPSMLAQVAAITALIASLELVVTGINANLTVVTDFQALLSEPGVHAYHYSGQVDDLGAEMSAELAGGAPGGAPTDACNALVVLTSVGATWSAMAQIFKTTP